MAFKKSKILSFTATSITQILGEKLRAADNEEKKKQRKRVW